MKNIQNCTQPKPILFCLTGLPASGKSHQAEKLSKEYHANIHSSDKLREELYGDVNYQHSNNLLFQELHKRIRQDLTNGKNTIFDATNINYKKRKAFLENLKHIDCYKICVLMATPYKDCIKQNESRERSIPNEVITKMYKSFYIPQKYEKFDDIVIIWNYNEENYYLRDLFNGENGLNYINQDNPNHTLTIGEHCSKCADNILKTDNDIPSALFCAALLHDIGKAFTKEFKNSKGEDTDIAHYYQHHLVSAYDSLFYTNKYNDNERLKIANYIQWHMQPFFMDTAKQHNKYKKLWGEEFYNDIMLLHESDKNAK